MTVDNAIRGDTVRRGERKGDLNLMATKKSTDPVSAGPVPVIIDAIAKAGFTQQVTADRLGVSRLTVNELCKRKRALTAEMALRLERLFGLSAMHLLMLQLERELSLARIARASDLKKIKPVAKKDG